MAELLFSHPAPFLHTPTSTFVFLPNLPFFRNICTAGLDRRKCGSHEKFQVVSQVSSESVSETRLRKRDLMLFGLSSSVPLVWPSQECLSMQDLKIASMVDDINAYSYLYPMEIPSKKFKFKWVESRKPERYSSAAPLSPDARLRIVSERVDIIDNVIISVSIGPPNLEFLKSMDKSAWSPKDVVDSVVYDKIGLRVTPSQRSSRSSVLNANSTEVDGKPYWYYEYLIRKSPTDASSQIVNRHYIGSTAERDGYLYSLNASTLGKKWKVLSPFLEEITSSFRLIPPTDSYVPPFKDPWRFW